MPDIPLENQPFDLAFHPSEPVLFTALLTGEVKAFGYDDETGESSSSARWTVRPSKRTARTIAVSQDGQSLWMGGKAGTLFELDTSDGGSRKERKGAHESPINRLHCVNEHLVVSGDDDGVIKFWDPRQEEAIKSYSHHFDYISDFHYFDDKRHLVTTSGDGHLSVIDIRSNKSSPLSISDDQDDELLSIVPIKGDTKAVVGTTTGILTVWNRAQGWGDCIDRIPGHPASVDALVALTPDVIASGSEDGMIRVIQILPHKFLGVIASHDDYPIERLKLDRHAKWLGSVSHDECIKLTDVQDMLEDSDDEDEEDAAESLEAEEPDDGVQEAANEDVEMDSDEEPEKKKRQKKRKKAGMGDMTTSVRNEDKGFFDDL